MRAIPLVVLAMTILATACSDPGVRSEGLRTIACTTEVLPGVTRAAAAAFVELRGERTIEKRGVLCDGATDRSKCEADYAAVKLEAGDDYLFGGFAFGSEREILIVTDVDGVKVLRTRDAVRTWLSPIATEGDAIAAARLDAYDVRCGDLSGGGVGTEAGGFRVLATRTTKFCDPVEVTQYLLSVDKNGVVSRLESEVVSSDDGACQ